MTQGPKDIHTEFPIVDERGLFNSLEMYSYRSISKSGLKRYCTGLEELLLENYEGALIEFQEGAKRGDPYALYTIYKMFATDNPFSITPDKAKAWYYLIASAVNFAVSIVKETAALELLKAYNKKFDNEKFDTSLSILNEGINEDLTPYAANRNLLKSLYSYLIIEQDKDIQKEYFLKYFENNDYSPELSLFYLRLVYKSDFDVVNDILRGNQVRTYISGTLRDMLLTFGQTGVLASAPFAKGILDSIVISLYYLIFQGENDDEEFEDLVLELYKVCSLLIYRDGMKFGIPETQAVEEIKKLDSIKHGVIAYNYIKGFYLKQSFSKAEEYLRDVQNKDDSSKYPSLRDYLVVLGKYRIAKANQENTKAKEILETIVDKYSEDSIKKLGKNAMPIDFWIGGYIQEKIFQNASKAKTYFMAGAHIEVECKTDTDIMGYLAFKRKCISKIDNNDDDE